MKMKMNKKQTIEALKAAGYNVHTKAHYVSARRADHSVSVFFRPAIRGRRWEAHNACCHTSPKCALPRVAAFDASKRISMTLPGVEVQDIYGTQYVYEPLSNGEVAVSLRRAAQ